MKMLESASSKKSAGKENAELEKKYAGYFIKRGRNEKKIDFIRRVAIGVVLEVNFSITFPSMVKEMKFLFRNIDLGIDPAFLANTLIFQDSGISIDGNTVYISKEDKQLARNILRNVEIEVSLAGGEIEKTELFSLVRNKTVRPLSEKILYSSLYNKGNLKWRQKGGKTIISLKK